MGGVATLPTRTHSYIYANNVNGPSATHAMVTLTPITYSGKASTTGCAAIVVAPRLTSATTSNTIHAAYSNPLQLARGGVGGVGCTVYADGVGVPAVLLPAPSALRAPPICSTIVRLSCARGDPADDINPSANSTIGATSPVVLDILRRASNVSGHLINWLA